MELEVQYFAQMFYFTEASHCTDLMSQRATDPDEVKKARAKIVSLLDAWLKESKYATNYT